MPITRPHKCLFCQLSFGRSEHLQRHIKLRMRWYTNYMWLTADVSTDTGEKQYQCPCGETFFWRYGNLASHFQQIVGVGFRNNRCQ
jgi:uncharacterized Zn-finger protein